MCAPTTAAAHRYTGTQVAHEHTESPYVPVMLMAGHLQAPKAPQSCHTPCTPGYQHPCGAVTPTWSLIRQHRADLGNAWADTGRGLAPTSGAPKARRTCATATAINHSLQEEVQPCSTHAGAAPPPPPTLLAAILHHTGAAAARNTAWSDVCVKHGVGCGWTEPADACSRALSAATGAASRRRRCACEC